MSTDVLVGIDLVELPRIERAYMDLGVAFVRAIGSTQPEPVESTRLPRDVAVDFGISECLVKVVGGRFHGVGLRDMQDTALEVMSERAAGLMAAVTESMRTITDFNLTNCRRFLVGGRTGELVSGLVSDAPERCQPACYVGWGDADCQLVVVMFVIDESRDHLEA